MKVDSELEVLNAADDWLSCKYEDRRMHAHDLLLKIRLHLLSNHCLDSILAGPTSFTKVDSCVKILREVLKKKNIILKKKPSKIYLSRFCCQDSFKINVSGGEINKEHTNSVVEIDSKNFKTTNHSTPIETPRNHHKAVYCRGDTSSFFHIVI